MWRLLLILPLLLPGLASDDQVKLPRAASEDLRELFTNAIAETYPAERERLSVRAGALQETYFYDDLAKALRVGPEVPAHGGVALERGGEYEELESFRNTTCGYSFEYAGRVYRYAVDIPYNYDRNRPRGVLLDPGHPRP